MKNESTEPAWSGYEQDIPVAQGSVQPAHNGSVAGSDPTVDTKYKRVDLDALRRVHPIRDIANGIYSSRSYEVDGYNRAIDDIKAKYGDLYVEVKP